MRRRQMFGPLIPALLILVTSALWAMPAAPSDKQEKATLTIKGMTCGGCVASVKLKLKKTKGVLAYDVSLEKGEADVTYDPDLTNPETIAAAVSETGFKATVKTMADTKAKNDGGA